MTINRGKFLKTIGWTTIGIGLYLVRMGIGYDGESEPIKHRRTSDNIIDVDFTVVED